jgi:carotenoid cleavage dioxygenase-like enzyme
VFHTTKLGGGSFRRYRLNMRTGEMSFTEPSEHESEFPTINPAIAGRPNDFTYSACSIDNGANSFFNAFQKVGLGGDLSLVTLPPGYYGSEPLFAPSTERDGEDAGYILEVVYNGFDHVSELQIFRADDITDKVATLTLKHHLPHQFHGYWHDDVVIAEAKAGSD